MFGIRLFAGAASLALMMTSGVSAQAQGLVGGTNDPSLVLLIWDPVNKVSYSRDTGLTGLSLYTGLSSAGSQQFWTLDPATDANFSQFLKASSNLAQDQWMVIGGGKLTAGTGPGTNTVFSTMINTVQNGTLNPEWGDLTDVTNSEMRASAASFLTAVYAPLNNDTGTTYNTYATAKPGAGSSFDTPSSTGYVGNMQPALSDGLTGLSAGEAIFGGYATNGGQGFDTGNLIGATGSSSWFYYLTPSNTKTGSLISVSAFSNSAQDAYWGLARSTDTGGQQELVLSFTLPSAVTPAATAQGVVRRNLSDFTAQYGTAQQIAGPNGQFAGWTPSTTLEPAAVVPEPTSPTLLTLGLAGVLAAVRRARRRQV